MRWEDAELWRRADAVFQEAFELPEAARSAFVARTCGDDTALRGAVEELLAADADEGGILDAPLDLPAIAAQDRGATGPREQGGGSPAESGRADDDAAQANAALDDAVHDFAEAPDPWIGRALGGFRILRCLGRGGMGLVYEAEQDQPRRRVALKLLRGGVDALELRLFRREAQALARLQHPGIAAIHEVGSTEAGEPYLIMELVRGVPFDVASIEDPESRLGGSAAVATPDALRERLDLFLEVCDAMAYAHQRGVLHRDLKPSNVLVAEDAFRIRDERSDPSAGGSRAYRVKIVDFGLARVPDTGASMIVSQTGSSALRGTLPYMSPEQTLGRPEDVDFRSDVYALGVLLYRFLTGAAPYAVRADALLDAVEVIRTKVPGKAGALAPALRGDVETILAKALEKEPDRRYQSVAGLADDVRRFLSHEPVLARPASAAYRLRKLGQRHRTAVALSGVLFAVLVGSTITMTLLFQEQRRASGRAMAEAEKAEAVNAFLREMLAAVDPKTALGEEVTVREVLDLAAGRIDRELGAQPEVQAALRATVGKTYAALGEYERAEPLLVAALDAQRHLGGPLGPGVAATSAELQTLYSVKGAHAAAESLARAHLAEVTAASGGESLGLAQALTGVANALFYRSGLGEEGQAEVESLLVASLAIRDRCGATADADYGATLESLGNTQTARGNWDAGEASLRRALAIRRAVLSPDHPDLAVNLQNLGAMYRQRGDNARAESLFVEALALRKRVLGERHPSVATTLNSLAAARTALGKYADAESSYREVIALLTEAFGPDHPNVARTKGNLAVNLETVGRAAEAEALQRQAIDGLSAHFGPGHSSVAIALTNLAGHVQAQGRLSEAEDLLEESLALKRASLGPEHESVASSLLRLGGLQLDRGQAGKAEETLRETRRILEGKLPAGHWRLAQANCLLGAALFAKGRAAEGESLLVAGFEAVQASPDAGRSAKEGAAERLAAVYERTGRVDLAAATRGTVASPTNAP